MHIILLMANIIIMAGKEVAVSSSQGLTRVISEVSSLLEADKEATITAINLAIPTAVHLVEIIKHKVKGLYQQNSFQRVKDTSKTRVILKLSLNPLDSSHPGYQLPIDSSRVNEKTFSELKKPPNPIKNNPLSQKTSKNPDKANEAIGKNVEKDSRNQKNNEPNEKNLKKTFGGPKNPENTRQRGFRGGRYRGGRARGGRLISRNPRKNIEPGMEKYKLIRDNEGVQRKDNEVYVSANSNPIFAIKNVLMMFKQKGMKEVVIKASGKAVPRAIHVVEEVKRKELDLHQQNSFSKTLFKDHYKPTEEGLDDVYKDRSVDGIEVILSKSPLDTNHPGYQTPLPPNQVANLSTSEVEKL